MEKKFLELIADVMEVEVEELSLDTSYEECEKWDSLMMLNLVMEIEEEYEISIPMDKVGNVKMLGDLYEFTK